MRHEQSTTNLSIRKMVLPPPRVEPGFGRRFLVIGK